MSNESAQEEGAARSGDEMRRKKRGNLVLRRWAGRRVYPIDPTSLGSYRLSMKARASMPGVLSIVPLAGFLWLMLYAYIAYLQEGYWPPVYGRPDPTNIRPWITGDVLMGVLMVFMFGSPAALAALLWTSSRRALRASTSREKVRGWATLMRQVSVFALGAVLFATELLRLKDWLLD